MIIYTPIIIKLGLGILCLIVQINLMGKGNLAPSSAMDQVQNYVLGGIIGGVIYNESITVLQFVLVLIIWTFLVFVLKFLKENNRLVKEFLMESLLLWFIMEVSMLRNVYAMVFQLMI